ncbi:hypothetical protein BDR26DRAFT_156668 [Obelidium mucronatum]|nr:hypothetical protein BDR26DRAFT_156668 [Obelidium mucronatum]
MARLAEKLRERAARASHALDHRIQVLRSKIKNPRQMQMIEKVTFVVAVISLLGLHQLMILAPHYIVTFYLWTMIPLMLIRYVDFHRQKWHYFMIDFCYYVNAVLFYFLIKDPSNSTLFKVVFTWSNGPLLWAIVVWRSGLVFHSLPHITTIYIHLLPAFVTYVIRWIPIDGQDVSSLCSGNACVMHVSDLFGWPIALYLVWQILYLVKTEVLDRKKLQADKDIGTSLRHLIAFYQNHFWGKVVNSLGPQFSILMFVLMQLVYTAVVSIPTALFYQNQLLHLGFILGIIHIDPPHDPIFLIILT